MPIYLFVYSACLIYIYLLPSCMNDISFSLCLSLSLYFFLPFFMYVFKDRKVLLWITLVLTYVRTYVLTYVQVIFRRSHPTLKLIKQKMSEIIQVNVPIFFYFAEIQKMTKLGPKNRFWDLKIKINRSGIRPDLHPSFFEIQT